MQYKVVLFSILFLLGLSFNTLSAQVVGDIIIKSINLDTEDVELENLTNAAIVITNWRLCRFPNYMSFSATIPANSSVIITFNRDLDSVDEMGLYIDGNFSFPSSMRDYVQWGSGSQGRSSVAEAAGLWENTDFVSGINNTSVICYGGTDNGTLSAFHTLSSDLSVQTGSCSVAPVELTEFHGREENGDVRLTWITTSEINNRGFEVHRSQNLRDWEIITFVQGRGNSNEFLEYQYLDVQALPGLNYYRLKQIDKDGRSEIFNTIGVQLLFRESAQGILTYPNPVTDLLYIELEKPELLNNVIRLLSYTGQVIKILRVNNQSRQVFDVSQLESGMYFLQTDYNQTAKFIKH